MIRVQTKFFADNCPYTGYTVSRIPLKLLIGGMLVYLLNLSTGKLHIKGGCYNSSIVIYDSMEFDTEDDARRYAGNSLSWCKICERKREQILKERNKT